MIERELIGSESGKLKPGSLEQELVRTFISTLEKSKDRDGEAIMAEFKSGSKSSTDDGLLVRITVEIEILKGE